MKTRRVLSSICLISSLFSLLLFSAAPAHAAPEVQATLAAATVSTGTPFTLSITVSWQGSADQYVIVPPDPELPEGVEKVSSSFVSSASADMQRMHYSFLLRALKNGDYTIKPAEVTYWARGAEKGSATAGREIAFRAVRFALVENNKNLIAGICVVGLAGACAGMVLIVLRRKKARRQKGPGGDASPLGQAAGSLQRCRQCKIQGDYAGFCRAALDCARMVAPQDTALSETLAAMLEKVQFGGCRPPAEELERILRQLEKSSDRMISGDKKNEPDYQQYCK